jgi:hypothetical protein
LIKGIVGSTSDPKYDTQLIILDKIAQIPVIHGFYDIVSTHITKMYNDDLIFTINLNDDPKKNNEYETTYLWVLSHIDPLNNKNQIYTIIIPNFGMDSNFKNKGWYLAVYDNIKNVYSMPLSRINDMTDNDVKVTIDLALIGNMENFSYTTAVIIRVNDTFLDKPPDYLIDSSPDMMPFGQLGLFRHQIHLSIQRILFLLHLDVRLVISVIISLVIKSKGPIYL